MRPGLGVATGTLFCGHSRARGERWRLFRGVCSQRELQTYRAMAEAPSLLQRIDEQPMDDDEDSPGEETEDIPKVDAEGQESHLRTRLPLSRIKIMMKSDPDVTVASQESAFLVCKATELFIAALAKLAFTKTQQGKRKTIQKRDVDAIIPDCDELTFLEGAV